MTTLSELITTLKGKMLPLTGGTLSGNLEIGGNATVSGKNIVRSINGTVAGTDGNVTLSIPSAYVHPSTHPASMITGLATVATSGKYSDLSGKPSLAKVATSGSYTDLSNKPSIPTNTSNWSVSKGTNGWARDNSTGLTIQWGKANINGYGYTTVTFPRAFSAIYSVTRSDYRNGSEGTSGSRDVASFTTTTARIGYEGGYSYIAIGIT